MSERPNRIDGTVESPILLSAKEKARELGVSVDFVRAHRHELGVITFGTGPRPRLMFRRGLATSCLTNRQSLDRLATVKTSDSRGICRAANPSGSQWRPIER